MRLPPPHRFAVCLQSFNLIPSVIGALLLGTSLATAQTVTVNGVTSGSITAAPGSTLTVSVSSGAGNLYDWIGFFSAGAANGSAWWYMNGSQTPPTAPSTSASFTTTAPTTNGVYEFRYFAAPAGDWGELRATSVTIVVAGAAPAITVNG